jgi:hypothetical protein
MATEMNRITEKALPMSPLHAVMPLREAALITSGDLRQSANQVCWPAQQELKRRLTQAFRDEGVSVQRAFPVDEAKGHGFISSQRMGMDVFAGIDPQAPDEKQALQALAVKAAMFDSLGVRVRLCGTVSFP